MIETLHKKHLKKDDLTMTITLYKEDTGCYRYSIDQIYRKADGSTSTRNGDFTAGALKSSAILTFEKALARMTKKGYVIL